MKIVTKPGLVCVPLGAIKDGDTFEHEGRYYIRPCAYIRGCGSIGGVNLVTGNYMSSSDSTMVRRVEMEAREL